MYYYKLFKVVYKKIVYKDTIFVSKNLWINIKIIYLHKLNNKPDPNGPLIS
jgi:hypothetical protein